MSTKSKLIKTNAVVPIGGDCKVVPWRPRGGSLLLWVLRTAACQGAVFSVDSTYFFARVVKLADTSDLGSDAERRMGSSPFSSTKKSLTRS